MPSFPDSIFLFVLALLLFGPKRLPVLARELGKWVGEFRRASNEFKIQMEEELRLSEQAEKTKQIEAMKAAAPVTPVIAEAATAEPAAVPVEGVTVAESPVEAQVPESRPGAAEVAAVEEAPVQGYEVVDGVRTPVPIAVSGDLKIMPPKTGLPVGGGPRNSALKGLLDAIPAAEDAVVRGEAAAESAAHGN